MYAAVENSPGNVPAFLMKLWTLVEDEATDDLIHWDASGTSFHVFDQQRFSREILPLYFKHNNIASFIRQLNMYGFRKVTHIDQGGLKIEKDDLQFQHQYFQKGQYDMLQYIKRKVSNQTVRASDQLAPTKPDEITKVSADVKQVKVKQDSMEQNLEYIKRENKLLWREVAMLRQKHHKQQQIVNKLIQFLVSLVSSNRTGLNIPIRRGPLAISGASPLGSQNDNNSHQEVNRNNLTSQVHVSPAPNLDISDSFEDEQYTIESPKIGEYLIPSAPSTTGPIIHELTENVQTFLLPPSDVDVFAQENQASDDLLDSLVPDESSSILSAPVRNISVLPQRIDSFLMSPKIEPAPTLEDALAYGLEVPVSPESVSDPNSSSSITTLSQSIVGAQKRKRKVANTQPVPNKKVGMTPTSSGKKQPQVSPNQALPLNNLVLASSTQAGPVANMAMASSKENDEFTISSNALERLSADLDGLRNILQDQYKLDPNYLNDLFEMSTPWSSVNLERLQDSLEDMGSDELKDDAGPSDNSNITGTELVEYNPRDDLFPELLDANIMGDIDDID